MSVQFGMNDYQSEGFKPFFNGWANAQITDFGTDDNAKLTGKLLWLEFTILAGVDKSRSLRAYYSYEHEKEDTQRISREQICEIARLSNVATIILPERASDFANKKIRIRISQKKGDDFPSIKEYAKFEEAGTGEIPGFEDDIPDFTAAQPDPYAS